MQACVQILFNPEAGAYSSQRIERLRQALEAAGAKTILTESSSQSDARIASTATHICVAGGDGTLRHAISAMAETNTGLPVAQYPSGTINLVAREAKYPANPERFAKRLLETKEPRWHHCAQINDETFLACASVGPECQAIASYSPRLKRVVGRLAYAFAFVRCLVRWRRAELVVHVDGSSHRCEAVYVAKGRYFAGPWSFAPDAALTDELLHVVLLTTARRRDFIAFMLNVMLGRRPHLQRGVRALTSRKLTVEGALDEPVQADGDIVATLPVEIQISPSPIRFI